MRSYTNLAFKSSLMIFILLVFYFLLMRIIGLHTMIELRYLNFFILLGGIAYSLRNFLKTLGGKASYLESLGFGFMVSTISSLLFSIFMFIYLLHIEPSFMDFLIQNAPFGSYLTSVSAPLIIFIEGAASGAILTFVLMQYYKRSHISGS